MNSVHVCVCVYVYVYVFVCVRVRKYAWMCVHVCWCEQEEKGLRRRTRGLGWVDRAWDMRGGFWEWMVSSQGL